MGASDGSADPKPESDSRLLPAAMKDIRALAEVLLRGERAGHALQTTALVNEAYLRWRDRKDLAGVSHDQFLQIAAQAMRRVLVDHARAHRAQKRGGQMRKISLDSAVLVGEPDLDLVELDEALDRLEVHYPRPAQVVQLRFFGGRTMQEVARMLGVSKRTVESDWTFARAWLRKELGE